jgi:hypothetical protein
MALQSRADATMNNKHTMLLEGVPQVRHKLRVEGVKREHVLQRLQKAVIRELRMRRSQQVKLSNQADAGFRRRVNTANKEHYPLQVLDDVHELRSARFE